MSTEASDQFSEPKNKSFDKSLKELENVASQLSDVLNVSNDKINKIEKRLKELHPNKEGFQTLFQFKDNDDFKKNLNEHLESKNYGKFSKLLVDKLIKNPSSVSMAPLYTAIILFLTWIFLFLQTINFYWLENIIPINLIEGLYFKGQN